MGSRRRCHILLVSVLNLLLLMMLMVTTASSSCLASSHHSSCTTGSLSSRLLRQGRRFHHRRWNDSRGCRRRYHWARPILRWRIPGAYIHVVFTRNHRWWGHSRALLLHRCTSGVHLRFRRLRCNRGPGHLFGSFLLLLVLLIRFGY